MTAFFAAPTVAMTVIVLLHCFQATTVTFDEIYTYVVALLWCGLLCAALINMYYAEILQTVQCVTYASRQELYFVRAKTGSLLYASHNYELVAVAPTESFEIDNTSLFSISPFSEIAGPLHNIFRFYTEPVMVAVYKLSPMYVITHESIQYCGVDIERILRYIRRHNVIVSIKPAIIMTTYVFSSVVFIKMII